MKRSSRMLWLGVCVCYAILFGACGQKSIESGGESRPTVTATPSPTVSPTPTLTPSPTVSPTPTATPSPAMSPTPAVVEEIRLDEVHFPDEAFRAYLSSYVDLDGSGALSQEERDVVLWIGNATDMGGEDASTYKKIGHQQLVDAGEIRSFEGIRYFDNLREIQLYTWSKAETLHLDHPKLEIVAVTVPNLKEFSLNNASNVKRFWYEACGDEKIAWEDFRNLEYFRVEGMEVNLSVLTQYEKLTQVSIYEGSIYADQTKVDFSALQQLQEIALFLSEDAEKRDNVVLEELCFAENVILKQVGLSRKLTEKLVLPDFETYYWLRGKGADCQVSYYAETVAEYPENPEQGAIPLNAEHFPDVAFRRYLYLYADNNRDRVLSAEECEAVTRIRNAHWDHDKDDAWNDGNWDTIYEGEEEEFDYASRITDLRGIEFFPNLYEIQLKGITLSGNLAELSLSNPKLEIIDLSFEGTIMRIDLTACESLRYCEIWANTDKNEPESVVVDLAGLNRIVDLHLNDNIVTTAEVVLATPTPSPTPELPYADHAMEWKDEKLEEAMRSVTDIYDREIMLSDVYDIVSLYLWGNGIEDISALAELKNLEELKIGNNKISDISVLAELPNLRQLEMQENEVTDISALKSAVNLERINAKDNQIADISVMAGLQKLRWIALENNCIRDISCLKGLEALECLRLNHNQITDISALSGFPRLKDVWLENNQITRVTDLTDLPELSVLLLNQNQITSVHLSGLPKLWSFDLKDNQICDISLSDLPELGMLELDNNCITDVSGLTSLKDLYSLGLTGNPVENIELLDFIPDLND